MIKRLVTQSFTGSVLVMILVAGCTPISQVISPPDGAPDHSVDPESIQDAVPREDIVGRAGNKNPYTVLGKTYHLLPTAKGYRQQGVASWYGTKFHGRPTANGEPYSLYGMTAAHKTLPIPAYVKVTNLANNRTAVVRVNDRGPFHDGRIIDLSYAAAVKLGYAEKGTANVLVEVIDPTASDKPDVLEQKPGRFFLQVGAFKSLELANNLRAELVLSTNQRVLIKASEPAGYYRVQLGPLPTLGQVQQVSERLLELNIKQPRLISE